jgi:hypothetical protein
MSSPRGGAGAAPAAMTALTSLPHAVIHHIFSLLPVDDRLRCFEVCRGWRDALLERSLWTRLDLSATSGVRAREGAGRGALSGLLRCASARAGGGLQSLHVSYGLVTHTALLALAAANAGALRELRLSDTPRSMFRVAQAEALLRAAPRLDVFTNDAFCDSTDVQAARGALRNEAPFGPLRVVHLIAQLDGGVDEAGVIAFAADAAAHASVCALEVRYARLDTPAAVDAIVDAALARRMHTVVLERCNLSPASALALARLLGSGALTTLTCMSIGDLLDEPAATALAAALRANATLTSLTLGNAGVFKDVAAAAELLGALTGHASLGVLCLRWNHPATAHQAAAGVLLGALVAANAPALTQLDVFGCHLGDDGLRALFEALPANTHLRTLYCSGNDNSEAFVVEVLLPAVRANVSLRTLDAGGAFVHAPQTTALVRNRR